MKSKKNSPTISKKEITHFFNRVLLYLGEYGWSLNLVPNSSEGYCWKTRKVIDAGENSKDIKQLIIHETAHIRTCRFCNNKHTLDFWMEFDRLKDKFLPGVEISESNKLHRQYMGNGFNRLCYGN
ncbi:MAG: hypothetical protein M0R32_09830 [Candidatus Cloacimonetes bacterium]|nr:hypothetical protein [Candidatus Cloacimonadota bacterium]